MNLFIFSFNFLKGLEIRENKNIFFVWIVLLTVLLVICGTILEKVDPHWPLITFETEAVKTYTKDTDLLLLGNSHFYSGINPEWIKGYNAAQISSSAIDYTYQLLLLKYFIDKMPNIKQMILQVSRQPLDDNTFVIRQGDFDLFFQLGISPFEIPRAKFLDKLKLYIYNLSFIRPLVKGPKFNFQNLTSFLRGEPKKKKYPFPLKPAFLPVSHIYVPTDEKKEMLNNYRKKHPKGKIISINETHKGIYGDPIIYKQNLKSFRKILEICKARGIRVYLLRTPLHPSNQTYELGISDLLELADEVVNYQLIDWYNNQEFMNDEFKDHRHLNEKGAKRLSLLLSKALEK